MTFDDWKTTDRTEREPEPEPEVEPVETCRRCGGDQDVVNGLCSICYDEIHRFTGEKR